MKYVQSFRQVCLSVCEYFPKKIRCQYPANEESVFVSKSHYTQSIPSKNRALLRKKIAVVHIVINLFPHGRCIYCRFSEKKTTTMCLTLSGKSLLLRYSRSLWKCSLQFWWSCGAVWKMPQITVS